MSRFFRFSRKNKSDTDYQPLNTPSVLSRPATCQGGYQLLQENGREDDAEETPQEKITRLKLFKDAYEKYAAGDIDGAYVLYSKYYLNGEGYKEAGQWMADISFLKAKQLKPEHLDMFLNKDDALGRIVMAQQFYEQGIREIKHVIRSINSEPREIDRLRRAYLQLNQNYESGLVWEYDNYDDKSDTQNQALDMLFKEDSGFENIEIIQNGIKISLILLTPQFVPAINYYKEELMRKPDDTNILYSIGMMYFFLALTFYHSGKPELQERARTMLFNSKVYFDKLLPILLRRQPSDDKYNNEMLKKVENLLNRLKERIGGVCPRLLSVGGGKSRVRRNKSRTRRNKSRKIKKRIRTKK